MTATASTTPTTAEVAQTIGRHIGLSRAAKRNGDEMGQKNHAEAALEALKGVELNYENLDWRQLAEGDAQVLIGNHSAAEKAYRQAMVAAPGQSGGYQRLAELLQELGRNDDLQKHVDMCIMKFPDDAFFMKIQAVRAAANQNYDEAIPVLAKIFAANNEDHEVADALGTCLQNINHFDEAALYHSHALNLQPTNAAYAVRYGLAFMGAGEHEGAMELFRYAIDFSPNFIDAYAYLGYELQNAGQNDEARAVFEQGLERDPEHANLNFFYGRLMQELGEKDAAIKSFDTSAAAKGPEAESAEFLSASVKGETPEKAPEKFVRGLFDYYAPNFEASLLSNLQYRAPAVLDELLKRPSVASTRDVTAGKQRILDLGCGTGLMGMVLRPYAQNMVGVDLSANMLHRANEKGIYNETKRQDIAAYVSDMPAGQFDLVVAADVFIYVGNLQPVFSALGQKLNSTALVAFCCEKLPDSAPQNFQLQSTVRYAHKDHYVRQLAADHGFDVLAFEESPVRQQAGQPVDGLYYVLAKR